MANHGIKFNETPRTVVEIECGLKTPQQLADEKRLQFIERGKPLGRSRVERQELGFAAEYRRSEVPGGRYPWEPRPAGHVHSEPVAEYKWLTSLLDPNPPWWKRLWRWVDPRKQFRDWDDR